MAACGLSFFIPRLTACFLTFLRIVKSEFLIQDLISRLVMNEYGISIYQNLSLGVDNQKNQILKIEDVAIVSWLLKHFGFVCCCCCCFFTHPVLC